MGGDGLRETLTAQGVVIPEGCTTGQLIVMSKRMVTGNCHGVLFSLESPECAKCLDRILCEERYLGLWKTEYSDAGEQIAAPVLPIKTKTVPALDNNVCKTPGFKEFSKFSKLSKLPAQPVKEETVAPPLAGVLPKDIKIRPGTKLHTVALLFFKQDVGVPFVKHAFLEEAFAFFGTRGSVRQIVHSVGVKLQDKGYLEIPDKKTYLLLKK